MVVDTLGLPHALFVSKASMTDRKGAISMIECQKDSLCSMETFLVDGGYMGETFAKEVQTLLPHAKVEVVKREELHTFQVLPKRWVVERSFEWIEQNRRLWKNCENEERETAERMIKMGKLSLDEIALCVPSLSFDELRELEAEVMQLVLLWQLKFDVFSVH